MPLLYGQLVYTSFPEVGYKALASAHVPKEIQLAFIEQVVYQYWDSYNPPESGYRAAFLHQITPEHTLFGWLYNDGSDDLGRSHVPYFVCYYYPQLLHAVQLEKIFACLHSGPIALIDRQRLPDVVETILVPECNYRPARRGVAIPKGVRDRSHIELKHNRLLDIFVPYQNNVLNMPGAASRILEILVIEPRSNEETHLAIQALREGKIVILKLSAREPKWAQRTVDFVTGGTYAIDGHTKLIGERTFLCTPRCVRVNTPLVPPNIKRR